MDAELIETLNENLEVTGIMPRSEVHEKGLLHAVVQLYIYQKKGKKFMLYLQQRSAKKYSYPLKYDMSCAGHIDPGETPTQAVIRETKEEIGFDLDESNLNYLGTFDNKRDKGSYIDNEIAHVFLYKVSETPSFAPGDEVEKIIVMADERYFDIATGIKEINPAETLDGKNTHIMTEDLCPHSKAFYKFIEKNLK